MPTSDFTRLPDEVLPRHEFLRPGPVPVDRALWDTVVAGGHAPARAVRKGRLTARTWADIRRFRAAAAADKARAGADRMADIPGAIFSGV